MQATYCIAICGVSLAVLGSPAMGQSRPAMPPSEANFFIGTPAGWANPKTPWGDPDLQGIWPLNNVGITPLQRCFSRQRYPGAAPDKIAACDPHREFMSEEEFKTIKENASKMPDRFADAAREGEAGRAFVTDRSTCIRSSPTTCTASRW